MGVIDEEGRLFGVVNVIDLLVVTVVLTTLVAGAAFVLLEEPEPPEERYLTVVLDDRPGGSVPTLDGDAAGMPQGAVQFGRTSGRVTDAYVAPTDNGGRVTVVRVRVNVSAASADRTTDRRLVTEDETYRVGEQLTLGAGEADYVGYVHAVDRSGGDLPVRTVNATVVARLPPAVADRVRAGDTQHVAGSEVARVTAVEREPAADDRTRIEMTVRLRVLEADSGLLYGAQRLRPGAEVVVAPDGYEFTGTVTGVA
jgi:hypothetical protein